MSSRRQGKLTGSFKRYYLVKNGRILPIDDAYDHINLNAIASSFVSKDIIAE